MFRDRVEARRANARKGAAGLALDWLHMHYEEEISRWFNDEYAGDLSDDEFARFQSLLQADPEFNEFATQNIFEFLLADGRLRLGRRKAPVMELVLGEGGPKLSVEQREYLRHLSEQPLRLYEVQEARPGVGLVLRDMLARRKAKPIFVTERSASQELRQWDTLGARLICIGDHLELSGAVYPMPRRYAAWLEETLPGQHLPSRKADRKREIGHWIVHAWLQSLTEEHPLPQVQDAATGDRMMFITEHYRVLDWERLQERLAKEPDVEGDRRDGWHRLQAVEAGYNRILVAINVTEGNRIELFSRSVSSADRQKQWFEQVAGDAVRHLTREISDPLSMLRHGDTSPVAEADIPEEIRQRIEHDLKRKHYASWPDEPLPALDGLTARQAVRTAEGKEKVIALLKDMENMEAGQSIPFDFSFLWDALGLERRP